MSSGPSRLFLSCTGSKLEENVAVSKKNLVKLNGRSGEGGGQVLRMAVCLASLTGTPIQIHHVRGNRPGSRGGGLKAQHVACVKYLAQATCAEVTGCTVGSDTVEFRPVTTPSQLTNRNIKITADSSACILLVFQALLPFLIFAGDGSGSAVKLSIQGGTNVSFSLSFDYLDQVLLPVLETFRINVKRRVVSRGWSHGHAKVGCAEFEIEPLAVGQTLKIPSFPSEQGEITRIDVTMLAPVDLQDTLKSCLLSKIKAIFPQSESNIYLVEDSGHAARMYTLLVAHTSTGLRFGKDWLYNKTVKKKNLKNIGLEIAQKVVKELDIEIQRGGHVDEHLQNQLVVFQALAEGRSKIAGSAEALASDRERVDRIEEPFGDGSMHTKTARWVTSELLPHVKWIDKGRVCEGVGWSSAVENS